MRISSIIGLSLLSAASLFGYPNLLNNPEFRGADSNVLTGWNMSDCGRDKFIQPLPGQGPKGENAVRLDFTRPGYTFRQKGIRLAAGKKYRCGAWIRTNALAKDGRMMLWDNGWNKETTPVMIRQGTKDWTKMEVEFSAVKSSNGLFTFGIYAPPGTKGTIDVASPWLIPVDDEAAKGAANAPSWSKLIRRIVPVTPRLNEISLEKSEILFYCPVELKSSPENYILRVMTSPKGSTQFSSPRKYTLPKDRKCRAYLGKLKAGEYTVKVELSEKKTGKTVAFNTYPVTVRPDLPKQRILWRNNLVGELADLPLKDGKVSFVNPRTGWIYVGFDAPYPAAKVFLNDGKEPVVLFRKGEASETMRFLPAGKHTIRITGASKGRLYIRLVPQIMLYPLLAWETAPADNPIQKDAGFYKKTFWHAVNTYNSGAWNPRTPFAQKVDADLKSRGIRVVSSTSMTPKAWLQPDLLNKNLRERNYGATDGVTVDELSAYGEPEKLTGVAEGNWKLMDFDKIIYTWVCDVHGMLSFPPFHCNLLAACSNASRGRGMIWLETYVSSSRNQKEHQKYFRILAEHMQQAKNCDPDAAGKLMMLHCGYLTPGYWCVNAYPEADYKVVLDDFYYTCATDPALKGLYGLGCYSNTRSDEEYNRWMGRLMYHYCVQGRKTKLSDVYGFRLYPGHLKNCDFESGFYAWKASPAEKGSLMTLSKAGFGRNVQSRRGEETKVGNTFALFRRNKRKPNTIRQEAVNLVPGQVYALIYAMADYEDVLNSKAQKQVQEELFCTIGNAEILPEYGYFYKGKRKKNATVMVRKIVFRAKADKAPVTFSDWKDPKTPGKEGVQTMLNFINLKPFYMPE